MGIFERLSRIVRANLNHMISEAEDPEKVLEQSLIDMQNDLVQLRQGVAQAIASQKKSEQQYKNNLAEAHKWQQRAQLALNKGDENLAREALVRKKSYNDTANSLKQQLDIQTNQASSLKQNLRTLEHKIFEAKNRKNMLIARAQMARTNEQLQSNLNGTNMNSASFDHLEEKVLQLEAASQAASELNGAGLESRFVQLEAGDEITNELEAMKQTKLSGVSSIGQQVLPQAQENSNKSGNSLQEELAELRNKLNKK